MLSIALSTLGFGGILYGFSSAGTHTWTSAHVYVSLIIGTVTLVWFILRQLKLEQPILEFRVFKNKMLTITTALGMFSLFAMIGVAVIMPIIMKVMFDFSAMKSG